jgi:hypothetical protein
VDEAMVLAIDPAGRFRRHKDGAWVGVTDATAESFGESRRRGKAEVGESDGVAHGTKFKKLAQN